MECLTSVTTLSDFTISGNCELREKSIVNIFCKPHCLYFHLVAVYIHCMFILLCCVACEMNIHRYGCIDETIDSCIGRKKERKANMSRRVSGGYT